MTDVETENVAGTLAFTREPSFRARNYEGRKTGADNSSEMHSIVDQNVWKQNAYFFGMTIAYWRAIDLASN